LFSLIFRFNEIYTTEEDENHAEILSKIVIAG
jgi:hypothetical protein